MHQDERTLNGLLWIWKSDSAESYIAPERIVTCTHYGGDRLKKRKAQPNTTLMSAMYIEYLNESAVALVCENWGHLKWFVNEGCLELAER